MNLLLEGHRDRGIMAIVPSSTSDSMNLSATGRLRPRRDRWRGQGPESRTRALLLAPYFLPAGQVPITWRKMANSPVWYAV